MRRLRRRRGRRAPWATTPATSIAAAQFFAIVSALLSGGTSSNASRRREAFQLKFLFARKRDDASVVGSPEADALALAECSGRIRDASAVLRGRGDIFHLVHAAPGATATSQAWLTS